MGGGCQQSQDNPSGRAQCHSWLLAGCLVTEPPAAQVVGLSWPFNFLSFLEREEGERLKKNPLIRRESKRRPLSKRKKEIKEQRK